MQKHEDQYIIYRYIHICMHVHMYVSPRRSGASSVIYQDLRGKLWQTAGDSTVGEPGKMLPGDVPIKNMMKETASLGADESQGGSLQFQS